MQENHGIDVDQIVVHRRLFLKIERFRYFGREDIYLSGLELFDFDIFFRFQLVDKFRAVFGGMVTSAEVGCILADVDCAAVSRDLSVRMNLRFDGGAYLVFAECAQVYPVAFSRFVDEACAVCHQNGRQGVQVAVGHRAVEEYERAVRVGDADNERIQLLDRRMAVRQDAPVFAAHHDRIAGNLRITQHTH